MSGQTPPGWYPDPYGTPGLQRWWDGGKWSESTQPAVSQPSTPTPWTPPAQVGGTPAPWQAAPQPPRGGSQGALWALVGGGGLVAILVVVAVLLGAGAFDGAEPKPTTSTLTAPQPTTPSPTPEEDDTVGQSPVIGTISDADSGLSFAKLGGKWQPFAIPSTHHLSTSLGIRTGESASVQDDYDGSGQGRNYLATAHPAVIPSALNTGSLEQIAEAWGKKIESDPNTYPTHTFQENDSRSYQVSGKNGWYYRGTLSFAQAASSGWNWRTEVLTVIIVERSGSAPAGLYLSIPDSHPNRGDGDLLVQSLKWS